MVSVTVMEVVRLSPAAKSCDRHELRNSIIFGSKMYFKLQIVLHF